MTEETTTPTPDADAEYKARLAQAAALMTEAATALAAEHNDLAGITLLVEALTLACGLPGAQVLIDGLRYSETPGYAAAQERLAAKVDEWAERYLPDTDRDPENWAPAARFGDDDEYDASDE